MSIKIRKVEESKCRFYNFKSMYNQKVDSKTKSSHLMIFAYTLLSSAHPFKHSYRQVEYIQEFLTIETTESTTMFPNQCSPSTKYWRCYIYMSAYYLVYIGFIVGSRPLTHLYKQVEGLITKV